MEKTYRIVNSNGMQGPAWRQTYGTIVDASDAIAEQYGWQRAYVSGGFVIVDTDGSESSAWTAHETSEIPEPGSYDDTHAPRIEEVR